jgi:hypothetical protein
MFRIHRQYNWYTHQKISIQRCYVENKVKPTVGAGHARDKYSFICGIANSDLLSVIFAKPEIFFKLSNIGIKYGDPL